MGKIICPLRLKHSFKMASEARLYTFSPETKNALRKFRLGTSRAKDPQAVIYQIDKSTMEIKQVDETIYSNMQELSDELPDNSPRYILLSYPLTMESGRLSPLRHDQLPTADVLERDAHAVRRREGADAEPGRGEPHHRDG